MGMLGSTRKMSFIITFRVTNIVSIIYNQLFLAIVFCLEPPFSLYSSISRRVVQY